MKNTTAKRATVVLAAIALSAVSSVYGDYAVNDKGTWPKSWPRELEPLRTQSRTLTGSQLNLTFYQIPFIKREELESAWPHILKVKSKGAPIVLSRAPYTRLG